MTRSDVELMDLVRHILRSWRTVLGSVVGAAVVALLVLVFWPPRFEGRATVMVRTAPDASSMLRAQLGGLADLAGSSLRVGQEGGAIATEVGLLQSRLLLGDVVDSLRLQFRAGRSTPPMSVAAVVPPGRFPPRTIHVDGRRIRLVDREDAVDDVARRVAVEEIGGDLIEVRFAARDSVTAAAVPNLLVDRYLGQRRTFDRDVNRRRVEFLDRQVDSVRQALAAATDVVRRAQQQSGVLALELSGQVRGEQEVGVEAELASVEAEAAGLDSLLAEVGQGDPRRIAGFPALLRSPAVNEIVAQMALLGIQRDTLRAEFTANAPRIRVLDEALDGLRRQLVPLARTYAAALTSQRAELLRRRERLRGGAPALAAAGESLVRAEADVKTLSALLLAISSQRLDARLAVIGEGGVVRVVDAAVMPRRPAFPRPGMTLAVGLLLGCGLGLLRALWSLPRPPSPI